MYSFGGSRRCDPKSLDAKYEAILAVLCAHNSHAEMKRSDSEWLGATWWTFLRNTLKQHDAWPKFKTLLEQNKLNFNTANKLPAGQTLSPTRSIPYFCLAVEALDDDWELQKLIEFFLEQMLSRGQLLDFKIRNPEALRDNLLSGRSNIDVCSEANAHFDHLVKVFTDGVEGVTGDQAALSQEVAGVESESNFSNSSNTTSAYQDAVRQRTFDLHLVYKQFKSEWIVRFEENIGFEADPSSFLKIVQLYLHQAEEFQIMEKEISPMHFRAAALARLVSNIRPISRRPPTVDSDSNMDAERIMGQINEIFALRVFFYCLGMNSSDLRAEGVSAVVKDLIDAFKNKDPQLGLLIAIAKLLKASSKLDEPKRNEEEHIKALFRRFQTSLRQRIPSG